MITDHEALRSTTAGGNHPRLKTWLAALAMPVAIVLAALLVYLSSYSAFTAQTETGTNSWSTGEIALTNDFAGTSVFTVTNMVPGDSDTGTIAVTYNGTVDSEVRMYSSGGTGSTVLTDNIDLSITSDATGATTWTGTLTQFQAITDYASGILATTMTDAQTINYSVTWTFAEDAPDDTQGESAEVVFVWEAQAGN